MALVLTRRPGEAVIIRSAGMPDRRVYVISIEGNAVRLSFEAPAYVRFIREELVDP